jgi:hypothetical protein
MSALKELVILLERHKSEELNIWKNNNRSSHQGSLYKYYLTQSKVNDNDACEYVYGKTADKGKFRKLKSDLRSTLEDLVLFMKIKARVQKDAIHEFAIVNKEFAILHNLLIVNANLSLIDKGERLFERATKIGATLVAKTTVKILIGANGIKVNKEKYAHYLEQSTKLGKLLVLEEKAAILYNTVQTWSMTTKASLKHRVPAIEKMLEDFRAEKGNLSSIALEFYDIMLELCMYSAANDHKKVFELAQKGAAYFNAQSFFHTNYLKSFHFYLIIEYGYHKEYEKAADYGVLNLDWIDEGSHGWFKTLELLTYAALRSGQYDATTKHYLQATTHELYEQNTTPMMRDIFKVYFAQLKLMQEGERYAPAAIYAELFKEKFKVSHFKNDLEISDKDKSGLNISVLFVDIAFEILRKRYDQISERFEAIQKYLQRYAEEEGKGRVYSYAKLLDGGIRYDWNLKKLQSDEFEPALHHLRTTQVDILNMRFEIEVLPYEELWDFMIEKITLQQSAN